MLKESDVLKALSKPLALYALQMRVAPGYKNDVTLHEFLIRMRQEGKVKFSIKTGLWSKP
jgi:hypothetical protein